MKKIQLEALIVFVLLAAIFGYFYQDPAWNGNSRIALTFAIVRDGTLTIDPYPKDPNSGLGTGDIAEYNGHLYTDKAPGSSLIAALVYFPLFWLTRLAGISLEVAVVKQILTFFALGLPSAISGALVYSWCVQVSGSSLRSLIVTLAVYLGTMIFPYSVVFFGHQLAGAFLFAAFFVIFQLKAGSGPGRSWMYVLIGLLVGLAILTEYPPGLIALFLGIYYLVVVFQKKIFSPGRSVGLPILGGLLPLLLLMGYNWACFGSPTAIGYQNLPNQMFSTAMAAGFMGIHRPSLHVLFYETFHPMMGLFWQSPVLLLTFVGAAASLYTRKWRTEVALAGAAAVGMLLLNGGYFMWWGGHALGTRAIIPMLPFLAIPLILVPWRGYFALIPLALVSIFQMLIASASNIFVPADPIVANLNHAGLFDYMELYNHCWWKLTNGVFGVNLGQQIFGLQTWASLVPLAVMSVVCLLVFWIVSRTTAQQTLGSQPSRTDV